MSKVTLDMNTFKALASDTRLGILRALDGKKMSLRDIEKATNLNKATLHEHLQKLNEAGLVKRKEREGHKWVYYKLTWKGEGLLHPENTRIVVMFSITFVSLFLAVILLVSFAQPITVGMARTYDNTTLLYEAESDGIPLFSRNVNYKLVAEIKSENQTLENITLELQKNAHIQKSIGGSYDESDFKWDVIDYNYPSQEYKYLAPSTPGYKNDSTNLTSGYRNTDNETNMSMVNEKDSLLSSSPFTEMIATVQDNSLLYLGIICLSIFGVLFISSTWRLWKNRMPKL